MKAFHCLKKVKLIDSDDCKKCFEAGQSGFANWEVCQRLNIELYEKMKMKKALKKL